MNKELFNIDNIHTPQILKITENYILLYKPPKMHSAPGKGGSIVEWCAEKFPEIAKIKGHKEGEGGLLHRLDYETQGLLLAARNEKAFEMFLDYQNQNKFVKEYGAISTLSAVKLPGFPLPQNDLPAEIISDNEQEPFIVESSFRPYGPGRKQVRPVLSPETSGDSAGDQGRLYRTEIIEKRNIELPNADGVYFLLRLYRGFRHQIRCHLAWEGFPILNDALYGAAEDTETDYKKSCLALRAHGIVFPDPVSGENLSFFLPPLNVNDL